MTTIEAAPVQIPSGERFRDHVREFLDANLAADWAGIGALNPDEWARFRNDWRRRLRAHGLLAVQWPTEYGGSGLSVVEQVILAEEFELRGVPIGDENDTFGIDLLGNTILAVGSTEQKEFFLPGVLAGEHVWCQGFSEPEAGSDLAGVKTTARLDGDKWLINGQKVWTSEARHANWIFLLARTDSALSKHAGLTMFLVPMDQPGVTVRPIYNANGYDTFSEVFLDDAVAEPQHILGGVNGGWSAAMVLVGFERGIDVVIDPIHYAHGLERLKDLVRSKGLEEDPHIRREFARCAARVDVMKARGDREMQSILAGEAPGAGSAITKIIWSEYFQRYAELAATVVGTDLLASAGPKSGGVLRMVHRGASLEAQSWAEELLASRAATIYAGTSEIQRNIIAERVLGLPKEPSVKR